MELNNGQELVTVVGTIPGVSAGEELRVIGNWSSHPNFGTQFKVEAFERSKPATAVAMLKYLSSGAIKGIGAATAARIVDTFGDNTLHILEEEPERLSSIKGITRDKARKIGEEFQRVHGIREMMLSLGQYGISPEEAVRIWKQFGPQAVERVQENPYCLCDGGLNIGFSRADDIAASLERPQDDICRLRAGLVYVLKHNIGNGHTCLPEEKLLAATAGMLGVDVTLTQEALEQLKQDGSVISQLFHGREFIFTPKLHRSEVYAAARIGMLLRYPAQSIVGIDHYIAVMEQELSIHYAEMQKQAIRKALSQGMLILTGGPGTGKTTTLNAIIKILERKGEKVLSAAPTGRAAKRMSDLTGKEAKTIHRLLQVEWDENDQPTFAKNEKNNLDCDALVIDELSMVDVTIFEAVLAGASARLPLDPGGRQRPASQCRARQCAGRSDCLGDASGGAFERDFPAVHAELDCHKCPPDRGGGDARPLRADKRFLLFAQQQCRRCGGDHRRPLRQAPARQLWIFPHGGHSGPLSR